MGTVTKCSKASLLQTPFNFIKLNNPLIAVFVKYMYCMLIRTFFVAP